MFRIDRLSAWISLNGLAYLQDRLHELPNPWRLCRIRWLLWLAFGSALLASAPLGGHAATEKSSTTDVPAILYFPNANSRPTYFTVHNIYDAWPISKGAGVKVGILDHSFGYDVHPGLYAGGRNFQKAGWGESFGTVSHHGFWMASTVREIAPEAEIYALGTYSANESEKVDAMVEAIDWAIAHDLDVLTYSAGRFSPEARKRLDNAVDRALEKGIVTTFIHYPHPGNLLPAWLGPRTGDDDREADVNILQYDYSVVFTGKYVAWMQNEHRQPSDNPFLSISSTSPVTAGFVALLKGVRPDLKPAEVKRILMETSRATVFEGERSPRTADIAAAVRSVAKPGGMN